MYKMKYSIAIIGYTSWCGLGFIRGMNSHKYFHNKYENEEPYLYSNMLINGVFGTLLYAVPILSPYFIYKEIYRLEIDVRNLENGKKSSFYNDLI